MVIKKDTQRRQGDEALETVETLDFEIKRQDVWSALGIRDMCVRNGWYTSGDNAAYEKMLDFVTENEPTTLNIYKVANDIFNHSERNVFVIDDITNEIRNTIVKSNYTVKYVNY